MSEIRILSSETINRIAAGEVVERPSNVVKELVENAIDAGASAITVEIRNGGIDLIRVTDNGSGIEPAEITRAFCRHATSKISDAADLSRLHSLGFRGEALSSIAAVSQVEMITKTKDALFGMRAMNDALPLEMQQDSSLGNSVIPLKVTEIGAPDGTSVIVRNLFYNVPVRRKFLKSPLTEAGYITDLVGNFALSHPNISFHYRLNNQEKLHTSGNGNIRELIYRIYGREMSRSVIEFSAKDEKQQLTLSGYLGRPEFSRANRSQELFFVNGRILKSDVLSKGLEEGYRTDLMQHRYPFAILYLTADPECLDVNVHPSKLEVRFTNPKGIYDFLNVSVHRALQGQELIPHENLDTKSEEIQKERCLQKKKEEEEKAQPHVEAFERTRESAAYEGASRKVLDEPAMIREEPPAANKKMKSGGEAKQKESFSNVLEEEGFSFVDKRTKFEQQTFLPKTDLPDVAKSKEKEEERIKALMEPGQNSWEDEKSTDLGREAVFGQLQEKEGISVAAQNPDANFSYDEEKIFTKDNARNYIYVGQLFDTYWIIEYQEKMLMIDQHAAHEKVNFERLMKRLQNEKEGPAASQMLLPPLILTLTGKEEAAYVQYKDYFRQMGYEIEPFGENSYALRGVPLELYANEPDELFRGILDEILDSKMSGTPAAILYKIASMSCKAAIKGNMHMSEQDAKLLIDELLALDNPYHCPHGRPTMIVLSKGEIERKFKRIV